MTWDPTRSSGRTSATRSSWGWRASSSRPGPGSACPAWGAFLGALEYLVYYSTSNNIDTAANAESNGTAVGSYAADIATKPVTGLTPSTPYYFNVVVRDEAGNRAEYTMVLQATTP